MQKEKCKAAEETAYGFVKQSLQIKITTVARQIRCDG